MIETMVIIFAMGAVIAYIFQYFRLPTVLGYILTGVLAGPQGLNLLEEHQVRLLAQIGIIFLLFIVGLELSFNKIRQLRFQAPAAGVLQLGLTTAALTFLLHLLGLPWQLAFLLASILALSSTAIVLKSLEDNNQIDTIHGRMILGILIIQDLSIVPLMTLLPTLVHPFTDGVLLELLQVLARALFFGAIAVFASLKLVPRFLDRLASAHNREIFTLTLVLIGMGMALLTHKMGLSFEAGAFVAGLALSGSVYCRQIVSDSRNFRDVFMAIFFVSMGLLFNPGYLFQQPLYMLSATAVLVFIKATCAYASVRALRFPHKIAMWSGLSLFQVGEFSFILLDRTLTEVQQVPAWAEMLRFWNPLLINAIVLSMFLTPLLIRAVPRLIHGKRRKAEERLSEEEHAAHVEGSNRVIIAGYGPTAENLAMSLQAQQIPYLIVEMNVNTVKRLHQQGIPALYGDISHLDILKGADVHDAGILAITFPDIRTAELAIQRARLLNPDIYCLVRSRYRGDIDKLYASGADEVVYEEFETSVSFIFNILHLLEFPLGQIDRLIASIREREKEHLRKIVPNEQPVFGRFSLLEGMKLEWLKLREDSELVGKTLSESQIRQRTGVNVVSVIDSQANRQQDPLPQLRLKPNDILVVVGSVEQLHELEALVG